MISGRDAIVTGKTAYDMIAAQADVLRKSDPSLTREQAFTRAYSAPENVGIRREERNASFCVMRYGFQSLATRPTGTASIAIASRAPPATERPLG